MPIENMRCIVEVRTERKVFGLKISGTKFDVVISEGGGSNITIGSGVDVNHLIINQSTDNRPYANLYANYNMVYISRIQNHLTAVFGFETECSVNFKQQVLKAPHILGTTDIHLRRIK